MPSLLGPLNRIFKMLSRRESVPHVPLITRESFGDVFELPEQPQSQEPSIWRETVVVRNRQGREEAFTIGPDGCVWSFFPDAVGSDDFSGYNLESLGMQADVLAVGDDTFGNRVVVAAKGLKVQYRVEENIPAGSDSGYVWARWSMPKDAVLPPVRGAIAVKRLHTESVFGYMHIAAVLSIDESVDDSGFALAYCDWQEDRPQARV
jgi:hypothetical protein